jgi:hypothetical protein
MRYDVADSEFSGGDFMQPDDRQHQNKQPYETSPPVFTSDYRRSFSIAHSNLLLSMDSI